MLYTVVEKQPTQKIRLTETHTLLVPAFSLAQAQDGQWFLPFFLTSHQANYYLKRENLIAGFESVPANHPALQGYCTLCQLPEVRYKPLIPYACQVMLLLYHPTPEFAHPYALKEILTHADSIYQEVFIHFGLTEVAKDRELKGNNIPKKFGDTAKTSPSPPTVLDKLKNLGEKLLFEKEEPPSAKKPKLIIPPHSPLSTEESLSRLSLTNK